MSDTPEYRCGNCAFTTGFSRRAALHEQEFAGHKVESPVDPSRSQAPRDTPPAMDVTMSERIAQLIAHRICGSESHDPLNGKIAGYCVVCLIPWPCAYAGVPAAPEGAAPAEPCDCGHPEVEHARVTPGCTVKALTSGSCSCLGYRPAVPLSTSETAEPVSRIELILGEGMMGDGTTLSAEQCGDLLRALAPSDPVEVSTADKLREAMYLDEEEHTVILKRLRAILSPRAALHQERT